jgi:hypothetical protein
MIGIDRRHRRKDALLPPPILKVEPRNQWRDDARSRRRGEDVGTGVLEHNQVGLLPKRQRTESEVVGDLEHRCRHSNSDAQ